VDGVTTVVFGNGTIATARFGDGTTVVAPPALGAVVFTTTGATFAPAIELTSGSSAAVTWQDAAGTTLATGLAPTISFGSVATRTVRMHVTNYAQVKTVNLGFSNLDDTGRVGPGAGYNKSPEAVSGVTGLTNLTGMVQFMAAHTVLTGALDFTGCAALLYIECFQARVTAVTLTGCTSLTRLCLESCRVSALNLNPVRTTLTDLRAAGQQAPSTSLTFTVLTGSLPQLWHYCCHDQPIVNPIPHSQLPVIEQWWTWNDGQTTSDSPISSVISSYEATGNVYDQASVNRILVAINTLQPGAAPSGGTINIPSGAAPSGAGATAKTALISRGWVVTTP
jgi:hypothetical protein